MKFLSFFSAMILYVSIAQGDSAIDTQIDQIMKASSSERVELMNQLKTRLATMNSHERNEALQKLSGNMGENMHSGGMNKGSMMQNRPSFMPTQQRNTAPAQHQMNSNAQPNFQNRQ